MRAVIVATGQNDALGILNERFPTPMLPLVDRPFIQHVVEHLVEQGVGRFDFILSHLPETIEGHLGDGRRWGAVFTYRLVRAGEGPYRAVAALAADAGDAPVLLGHGDSLPALDLASLPDHASQQVAALWEAPAGSANEWTGWAVVSPSCLADLAGVSDRAALAALLYSRAAALARTTVDVCLRVDTFGGLLAAQESVMGHQLPGLLLGAAENDPGIWIGRNVSLHPTASLTPPVFVAPDCSIGRQVSLGPNAVIGHGCVIQRDTLVRAAAVFPGSYVGEGLELDQVLVDRNTLVNVRLGEAVTVREDFILGSLRPTPARVLGREIISRLVALALLLVLWPLLALTYLAIAARRRGLPERPLVLRLPAAPDRAAWRTYRPWSLTPPLAESGYAGGAPDAVGAVAVPPVTGLADIPLRFLPGLIDVLVGRARLAGLPARTADQVNRLPHDWRMLYLGGRVGLVSEEQVTFGQADGPDDRYAAEAFFVAASGFWADVQVVWAYFTRVVWRSASR